MICIKIHGTGHRNAHGPLHKELQMLFADATYQKEIRIDYVHSESFFLVSNALSSYLHATFINTEPIATIEDCKRRLSRLGMEIHVSRIQEIIP